MGPSAGTITSSSSECTAFAMSSRFVFHLYRTQLGEFDFRGPARLFFDPRFGPYERSLAEEHEHVHWELANATWFGTAQLALAYAGLVVENEVQRSRYQQSLEVLANSCRLVHEGCAVYHEQCLSARLRAHSVAIRKDYLEGLDEEPYRTAARLYQTWLDPLPYSLGLKMSLALNAAELCLNGAPPVPGRLSRLDPGAICRAFREQSPDDTMERLSRLLSDAVAFAEHYERTAIQPVMAQYQLEHRAFELDDAFRDGDPIIRGRLAWLTYEALRAYARSAGLAMPDLDAAGVDLARYDLWLRWVRQLPGHQQFYPNIVRDVGRSNDDFDSVRTTFEPPFSPPSDDIRLSDWSPLLRVRESLPASTDALYVAIEDGTPDAALTVILADSPRSALISGGPLEAGSLWSHMTDDEARESFIEATTREVSRVRLRVDRAVRVRAGHYAWRFGGARYSRDCEATALEGHLDELRALRPTVVARWRNLDARQRTVLDIPVSMVPGNVGVLVEESSLHGWNGALSVVASAGLQTVLHAMLIGVQELICLVAVVTAEEPVCFLYSLATESLLSGLQDHAAGHESAALHLSWTDDVTRLPGGAALRSDAALACEHLALRGF